VPGVLEDLGLGGVALLPLVVLLELRGERVRIGQALHVDPGARVSVPVPGAADVGAGLEHDGGQVEPAQLVQQVHPGEAGTDDHGVDGTGFGVGHGGLQKLHS
jgi:hypothetical protein